MMKPAECKDITDVRMCIDEIDFNIITNLAQRASFVKKAAEFKKTLSEVKAEDRVKLMMEARRTWAKENNLNADFVQSIFQSIVDYFVKGEIKEWEHNRVIDPDITIVLATINDASAILALQKRAFIQEAEKPGNDYTLLPLVQTIDQMKDDFNSFTFLKAMKNSQIVGSVRATMRNKTCLIGRLVVEPFFQKNGIGKALLQKIEKQFNCADEFELFTGINSKENISFYSKNGYSCKEQFKDAQGTCLVKMIKPNGLPINT
jgi:chorismate mutase/predicted N-acetyltransferase YhbS